MGVIPLIAEDDLKNLVLEQGPNDILTSPGSSKGGTSLTVKLNDKQGGIRRRGMEKSVLDDIMGDPDDFGDLGESDPESDVGRWEDTLKEYEQDTHGTEALMNHQPKTEVSHELDDHKYDLQKPFIKGDTHIAVPFLDDTVQATQYGSKEQIVSERQHGLAEKGNIGMNNGGGSNTLHKPKAGVTRYFIIKSLNHYNIEKSIERGIWATQAMNEPILNDAFESAEKVLLIFSVNMSGHFQGYAQMISPIGRRRASVWSEANWGGTFDVEWIRMYDLPFQRTVHLRNPLNSFKPVKISRDCQELTQEIGEALCALIDEGADTEVLPKRKFGHGDAFLAKKLCIERPAISGGVFRAHSGATSMTSLMYPGNFAPPVTHEQYNPQLPVIRSTVISPSLVAYNKQSRNRRSKSPRSVSSGKAPGRGRDKGRDKSQHEGRERIGSERERDFSRCSSEAPLEDDFLNMTYEEYLQRHGNPKDYNRRRQQGPDGATSKKTDLHGAGWASDAIAEPSCSEDQYNNYLVNWYGNQQGLLLQNGCYYGAQAVAGAYPGSQPL